MKERIIVYEQPIREIVKDEKWQELRKSFLGTWNKTPEANCKKLRSFLGPMQSTTVEKLRIVMNYLTGTAFRIGKIKGPCIQKLRDDVSAEMKKRKKK